MTNSLRNFGFLVLLGLILISAFFLMFNAAKKETAIFDESAHIPAGYGYVKYFDYRLNPEHPPLVKALSAIPLLFMDLNFPDDQKSWLEEINGQWQVGSQFLYGEGNDADAIIVNSRIFPIIIALLAAAFVYFWSRELLGKIWAFLPTILFAFSPVVLAHGHYVTTDVGATLGVLLATFGFIKFLMRPSPGNVFLAGITLGLAELAKFSNALLGPYFIILAVVFFLARLIRKDEIKINSWAYFRGFIGIIIVAFAVVYSVYFLFTLNYPIEKQLSDAGQTLSSFEPRWLVNLDLSMIKNEFLRPVGQYLFGLLMILQRAAGGNTAYFLGELSAQGWWYYFPLVFLVKEPVPSLIMILFALILAFSKFIFSVRIKPMFGGKNLLKKFADYLGTHFTEFAMLVFIAVYWSYSIKSNLNIGIRHLLPTLPFIYILAAGGVKNWAQTGKKSFKYAFVGLMAIWYLAESLLAAPHFLSYFNEIAGGSKNGYRFVTDSNYDWGQDLKQLKSFIATWNMTHENKIEKIAVDYFGGGSPKYALGDASTPLSTGKEINWWSARGNPKDQNIEWLAVSINTLEGAFAKSAPDLNRKPEDEYRWLQELRPLKPGFGNVPLPDYRVGTSIFIYKL